jgi:hypothetical protein
MFFPLDDYVKSPVSDEDVQSRVNRVHKNFDVTCRKVFGKTLQECREYLGFNVDVKVFPTDEGVHLRCELYTNKESDCSFVNSRIEELYTCSEARKVQIQKEVVRYILNGEGVYNGN